MRWDWLFWWKKKKKVADSNVNFTPAAAPAAATNQADYKTERGFLGEDAYNWLLKYDANAWDALYKQTQIYFPDFQGFNQNTYYQWCNVPQESYLPFDFCLNAQASWDYGKVKLQKVDTSPNAPIILIDVKTTTQHAAQFYRSLKEDKRIDELLHLYPDALYFIALILLPNAETTSINDMSNWKLKYIPYRELMNYYVKTENDKIIYKFTL